MSLEERVINIEDRIERALSRAGRPSGSVTLVAVGKHQSAEIISQYCLLQKKRGRQVVLGENYVQEFSSKISTLPAPFTVHLIGSLQRNKVRKAVQLFDVIESVDSLGLLAEIDKEASRTGKIQTVYLQVNISKDPSKSGFAAEELSADFIKQLSIYPAIKVAGLMAITRYYESSGEVRPDFRSLKSLANLLQPCFPDNRCLISMGMSEDFEVAIEEGATHVRIGTALFGARD